MGGDGVSNEVGACDGDWSVESLLPHFFEFLELLCDLDFLLLLLEPVLLLLLFFLLLILLDLQSPSGFFLFLLFDLDFFELLLPEKVLACELGNMIVSLYLT